MKVFKRLVVFLACLLLANPAHAQWKPGRIVVPGGLRTFSAGSTPIAYKNGWYVAAFNAITISPSAGDFLEAEVSVLAPIGSATITPPAGWALVASNTWTIPSVADARHSIYQRTATGSEGPQQWTVPVGSFFQNTMVTSWSGVDLAVGIEAFASSDVPGNAATPISTSQSFPALTTLTPGAMVLTTALAGDSSGSASGSVWPTVGPTGFTTAPVSVSVFGLNYNLQASVGSTGSLPVTLDTDVLYWSAWTVALKPQ